jgi:hypothetical protein
VVNAVRWCKELPFILKGVMELVRWGVNIYLGIRDPLEREKPFKLDNFYDVQTDIINCTSYAPHVTIAGGVQPAG